MSDRLGFPKPADDHRRPLRQPISNIIIHERNYWFIRNRTTGEVWGIHSVWEPRYSQFYNEEEMRRTALPAGGQWVRVTGYAWEPGEKRRAQPR